MNEIIKGRMEKVKDRPVGNALIKREVEENEPSKR